MQRAKKATRREASKKNNRQITEKKTVKFINLLVENQVDMPREFQKTVDKYFWDLV